MHRLLFTVGLALGLSLGVCHADPAGPGDPLPSRFEYQMDKFKGSLPYIEGLLQSQRWTQAKEAAEALLEDIDKRVGWTNGAVHPENPAVLGVKAQASALLSRALAGAGGTAAAPAPAPVAPPAVRVPPPTASAEPDPPPAATSEAAAGGPLPSSFQYHFDKLPPRLEAARSDQGKGRFEQALETVDAVLEELAQKVEWSRGKVSPDHPQVAELRREGEALRAVIAAEQSRAGAAAAELEPVVKAIQELAPRVSKAVSEGRFALGSLTGLESSYSTTRDVERVEQTRDEALRKIAHTGTQAALAAETAAAFRAQFPDRARLEALLPDAAYEAFAAVEVLEREARTWQEQCSSSVQTLVDAADEAVTEAEGRLVDADPGDKAQVSAIDSSARMYAIDLYGRLMGVPAGIFPDASGGDRGQVERAEALQGRILALEDSLSRLQGKAAEAALQRVREARFPTRGVAAMGEDGEEVLAAIRKQFTDGPILRAGVYAPWETRTEARWIHDRWDVGTFRYLGVVHATATPSGKTRVFWVTVRRRQQADGSWGPMHQYSVGDSFEILPENVGS